MNQARRDLDEDMTEEAWRNNRRRCRTVCGGVVPQAGASWPYRSALPPDDCAQRRERLDGQRPFGIYAHPRRLEERRSLEQFEGTPWLQDFKERPAERIHQTMRIASVNGHPGPTISHHLEIDLTP